MTSSGEGRSPDEDHDKGQAGTGERVVRRMRIMIKARLEPANVPFAG
jgi:hypothetical protein